MVVRPSRDLGLMAGELISGKSEKIELNAFLRFFIRNTEPNGELQEADLLSYLLFDNAFTTPLVELGYEDARSREEELLRFFDDDSPPLRPASG